jgi:hypothetical protein
MLLLLPPPLPAAFADGRAVAAERASRPALQANLAGLEAAASGGGGRGGGAKKNRAAGYFLKKNDVWFSSCIFVFVDVARIARRIFRETGVNLSQTDSWEALFAR